MKVVIDASVTLKWMLRPSPTEQDLAAAKGVLAAIGDGRLQPLQPTHWLVEVIAVIARQEPGIAGDSLRQLRRLPVEIVDDHAILARAIDLAVLLKHHLFDTLYHAVALERDAVLITSDDRYFAAARKEGHIQQLNTFDLSRGA